MKHRVPRSEFNRLLALSVLCCAAFLSDGAIASAQPTACRVADISTHGTFQRGNQDESVGILFYTVTPTADTTMTEYLRDAGGQWPLDLDVGDSSSIQLTLDTPQGQFRIRLNIRIGDLGFREHQQNGILAAIEAAFQKDTEEEQPAAPSEAADPTETAAATEAAELAVAVTEASERVQAARYRRSDVVKKLAGYLRSQTSAGESVSADAEELQWMVSQWLPGGRLLVASPKFGLQHAGTATLFEYLAGDDFVISPEEWKTAAARLNEADTDGDGLVTLAELSQNRAVGPTRSIWPTRTLMHHVPHVGTKRPPADLTLSVWTRGDGGVCGTGDVQPEESSAESDTLTIDTEFGELRVLPVVDKRTHGSPLESGQFSIGAMLSPDPLLRVCDSRQDGRLDMREISQLTTRLQELDHNGDGEIAAAELPNRLTLVISQGPWANRLAEQVSRQTLGRVATPTVAAPKWFTGMDANKDGLLVRAEFLGSGRQFRKTDKDGDGVISVEEARGGAKSGRDANDE